MALKQKGREVCVAIESLSEEGEGLSSLAPQGIEGLAATPFTVPGDEALVRLLRKRSGIFSSQLLQVEKPSPLRVPSRA